MRSSIQKRIPRHIAVLQVAAALVWPLSAQTIELHSTVTYVAPPLAYINAGRDDGLAVGDTVRFLTDPARVDTGTVIAVALHSSAVQLANARASIRVGTTALCTVEQPTTQDTTLAAPAVQPRASSPSPAQIPSAPPPPASNVVSGRAGFLHSGVASGDPKLRYNQPGLMLRFSVDRLFGEDLSLNAYNRSYYETGDRLDQFGRTSRFRSSTYELSLQYGARTGPIGVIVGRTTPRYLGSLGTMDGGLVSYRFGSVTAGVLGGARSLRRTTSIDSHSLVGAMFVEFTSPFAEGWTYTGSLSIVKLLYNGRRDREFLALQNSCQWNPQLSIYQSAEIELVTVNRGITSHSLTLSSSYLSAYFTPGSWLSVHASYDVNRPVYYLQSMRAIPDTLFGQSYLHSIRVAPTARLPYNLSLQLFALYRIQRNIPRGTHSLGAALRAIDVLGTEVNAGTRYTSIRGAATDGGIWEFNLDRTIGSDLSLMGRVERFSYRLLLSGLSVASTTFSISGNYRLSRMVYLVGTLDRVEESGFSSTRFYFELGVRF